MTRTTIARIAGLTFLLYIAIGVTDMVLSSRATAGGDTAGRLATIAAHAPLMGVTVILRLLTFVTAVVLAVALYRLTHDEDRDVAALALCFRISEAIIGVISTVRTVALLSIATATIGAVAVSPDVAAANVLFRLGGFGLVAATCFAIGSALYSYLFLRARSIPVPLSWLGIVASLLLVLVLPAQLAGFVRGPVTSYVWIPMFVFEVGLALWLLIKGVAPVRSGRYPNADCRLQSAD